MGGEGDDDFHYSHPADYRDKSSLIALYVMSLSDPWCDGRGCEANICKLWNYVAIGIALNTFSTCGCVYLIFFSYLCIPYRSLHNYIV